MLVFRPGSRYEITGETQITVDSLHRYEPDKTGVQLVRKALMSAGFELGPVVGISMALTGSPGLFESYFSTRVRQDSEGTRVFVDEAGKMSNELPARLLPPDFTRFVKTVLLEPPVDLHGEELGI